MRLHSNAAMSSKTEQATAWVKRCCIMSGNALAQERPSSGGRAPVFLSVKL